MRTTCVLFRDADSKKKHISIQFACIGSCWYSTRDGHIYHYIASNGSTTTCYQISVKLHGYYNTESRYTSPQSRIFHNATIIEKNLENSEKISNANNRQKLLIAVVLRHV